MSSFLLREALEDDAAAIAELFVTSFGVARPTDAEEIRLWLRNEEIAADDVRVLELDGRVVGYADVWAEDAAMGVDVAAPGHWDALFDWAEERTRASGKPRIRSFFPAGHALAGVVEARGYRYWRSAFTMEIDLARRPQAPALPAGLELRAYADDDADALRTVLNETFADDPFFTEVTPSRFRESYVKARGFDPALWQLAWSGEELTGFALAFPARGSDDSLGWVGNLAVRAPARRRGLGAALLQHAFAALYDRGLRRAGLGVDAENPTGALGLYERAGLRVVGRLDNWVLEL